MFISPPNPNQRHYRGLCRVENQKQHERYRDQSDDPNPTQNQIRCAQRIRGAPLVLGHAY